MWIYLFICVRVCVLSGIWGAQADCFNETIWFNFPLNKISHQGSGSPTVHGPSFPDSAPNWTSLCTCLREIGKIHHLENVIFFSLPAVHSLFCAPLPSLSFTSSKWWGTMKLIWWHLDTCVCVCACVQICWLSTCILNWLQNLHVNFMWLLFD